MKEGDINAEIVKATQRELRGSVVTKHAERATRDVPDISVVYLGPTYYCETKRVPPDKTIKQVLRETRAHTVTQLLHLGQLATASNGRAWAFVYYAKSVAIWTPQRLFAHAFPELVPASNAPMPYQPRVAEDDQLAALLFSHGAIDVPRRSYDLLAKLIQQKG